MPDGRDTRLAHYDVPALVAEALAMECAPGRCIEPTVALLATLLGEAAADLAAALAREDGLIVAACSCGKGGGRWHHSYTCKARLALASAGEPAAEDDPDDVTEDEMELALAQEVEGVVFPAAGTEETT